MATAETACSAYPPPTDGSALKILPLTSVRFLAALFVVVYHLASQVPYLKRANFLGRLISLGYVSVSFFFMLSGFVLALAYLQANRPLKTKNFLLARFARIYPALFVFLLFDLPHFIYSESRVAHEAASTIFAGAALSFAALSAWFRVPQLDTPSWSISVEFFFYVTFPFIALALWRSRPRVLWTLAALLYFTSNAGLLWLQHAGVSGGVLERNPLSHLPEFLLGIMLARIPALWSRNSRWEEFPRRLGLVAAAAALLAFLAIPLLALPFSGLLMQHALLTPLFAVLILAFAGGNPTLAFLFSPRWFVVLGEASFALYLLHFPLAAIFRRQIERHPQWFPAVYVALAIALSVFSFFYIEKPARKWILARAATRSREDIVTQALAQ